MPLDLSRPFNPAFVRRRAPLPTVRRDTHNMAFTGSSSTSGDQYEFGNIGGKPKAGLINKSITAFLSDWTLPGSKTILNVGVGGADTSGTEAALAALADDNSSLGIQCDLQDSGINKNGGGHLRMAWLYNTVWDKGNAYAAALVQSTVLTEKRVAHWVGTNAWNPGNIGWFNNARFERLAWEEFPGLVINEIRYWQWTPAVNAKDDGDRAIGQQPSSMMITDRSHRNSVGYRFTCEAWIRDFYEAMQGGLPFFADHRYDVTAATCQTNGGVVCTLAFVGSLSGCTLSLHKVNGDPHPDFAIDSATAAVTRATGTAIATCQDIFLRVRRGDQAKEYHLELNLFPLTTAPGLSQVDGHFGLSMLSNDNAGTLYAPDYPDATARLFAGVPAGQTEGSAYFVFQPDAEDTLTVQFLMYCGMEIQRLSSGAVRLIMNDDGGTSFGSSSTSTSGSLQAINARGLMYCFYSFSCPNNRQQLHLVTDSNGSILTSGAQTTTGSRTTGALNKLAKPSGYNFNSLMGGTQFAYSSPFKGKWGPSWISNKEVDWSNATNRALVRAGAGSFVDLGAQGKLTPAAGANAGVEITPFHYMTGRPAELVAGHNRGTGGHWESWQRRDWRRLNWAQGVPQVG